MGAESRRKRDSLSPAHCEIEGCVWPYKIQRHRIWPGREGGRYKVGNVISLCPSHHWMADHDYLSREELWQIVEDRLERDGIPVTERYNPELAEGSGAPAQAGSSPTPEPVESDGVGSSDEDDGREDGEPSE